MTSEFLVTISSPIEFADAAVLEACERADRRAGLEPVTDRNPEGITVLRHAVVNAISAAGKVPHYLHCYEPYSEIPTDSEEASRWLAKDFSGVVIEVYALGPDRTNVRVLCKDEVMHPLFDAVKVTLAEEFAKASVAPDPREETERRRTAEIECEAARLNLEAAKLKPQVGRRGTRELEHDDRIRRLALAQEAVEIKRLDTQKPWKEIIKAVHWPWGGSTESAVKLLEIARSDLAQLEERDPDGLLAEVAAIRKEKKI
ncbi:MAG: hypothetical protein M1582_05105 [Actinobacteria bacterium]|nr:hypothetical protein [Actinomycetota bacterium]